MKTEEDEAFDELARKQGMWGGGFQAKRQAAMDKINSEFHEEYIKYRTAFPKEYTAPQSAQECPNLKNCKGACFQCEYFNSATGEMNYPTAQSAQEPTSYLQTVLNAFGPDEGISLDQKAWSQLHAAIKAALAQPADNPYGYDWSMLEAAQESLREHMARIKELEAQLAQPAQEPDWKDQYEKQKHEQLLNRRLLRSSHPQHSQRRSRLHGLRRFI